MILLWVFFGMDLLKDQSKAVCIYLGLYNSNSSDIRTLVNSTTNIYDGGIMQFFISCFISGIICFYLSIRKRETHMSLLLLGIITSMPYQLYAYDTNITHQNITAGAITLLNLKSSATYFELLTEEEQIKQGSTW